MAKNKRRGRNKKRRERRKVKREADSAAQKLLLCTLEKLDLDPNPLTEVLNKLKLHNPQI